ncbi:zinc-dependent metalloprotease [Hymenobacter psychrophilus]|uniref:Por secretion system C-terminal sorting domain-containing protein n=1 Tax=Hymenobacter psychrophilus TaxID=651662 RepID=A0A1H3GR96_9BACT|nr:zinc-dependent metalloprotease [Hymenobacter psychrophilus]SDY05843.1 Por secretion system C-terminal sorting domain-containing protein [Hymenobacter psychrophilus]
MQPTISSLRPLLGGLFFAALIGHSGPAAAQSTPANPTTAVAQASTLWEPVAAPAAARGPVAGPPARWFRLDTTQLAARLALAPLETRPEAAVPIELPHPDGTLHRYTLTQVPVMAPALAARYPRIRTFAGRSLDEPAATVRLEWTSAGLHAQLLGADGAVSSILGDESAATPALYQSRAQAPVLFDCQALLPPGTPQQRPGDTPPAPPAPYGSQLRTLRLAVATTNEFVSRLGGGTTAGTMSAIVQLVNSLNGVYERELALRLQLVPDNDKLIFASAATDPFGTGTSPTTLLNANAGVLNTLIGAANYDLGHVLGYNSGGYSGVAYVGVVCSTSSGPSGKGGGASTASSSSFLSEVTLHEIGHQLGSNHTFNGDKGNCSGGNRSASLAYEPGAGNTIMSYDSRCAPDNVGPGIVYFHAASLSAIIPRLTCGTTTTNNGNQAPTAQVPTGSFAIPKGTPFTLTGSASDADQDQLTYSWEQLDLGDPTGLAGAATDASAPPLFRSFAPVASSSRTFPQLSAVLNNSNSEGEILPLVARPLNFRLTVRDKRGGVAGANLRMSVADAGPFRVTAPAAALTAAPGSTYAVTWDVLGTDQAPVNCANVRILFSSDGGLTFPTVLAASVLNNGTASVRLPSQVTTKGRLKVEAVGNVFFALSTATITLSGPAVPLPVTLVSFAAEARGTAAHLRWRTATELNNAGFAVEVSTDGSAFRRRAWVPGSGQAATYEFHDDQLPGYGSQLVYYRLRQLDFDSTASLSEVRSVTVPAGSATWQIWPNPTREGRVTVAGLLPGQPVQLLDLTGRVLLTTTMPPAGPLRLELPAPLRPGMYLVRSGAQSRRLVVE